MSLLAIASLTASVICLGLGVVVLALNKKQLLNKIFFLMTLAGFIYAFTIVMMWAAPNYETAYIWHKAGSMWPFFVSLVLNFALVYTQNKWIKNKLNYILIYAPASVFFLVSLGSAEITAPPIQKYWGYNDLPGGTWMYALSVIWSAVIPLLAFLLCVRYYRRAKDPTQKQSGKLVMIGFAIPIIIFILSNVLAPAMKLDIPNTGIFSTLFCSVFVGYAIHKYELFEIDGSLASENIVNTIPDALVITDMDGRILQVNDNFINRSGYDQEELIGQSIKKFCTDTDDYREIFEKLKTAGFIRDQEVAIVVKSGEQRIVLFSGSIILSRSSRLIGLTFIVHDITERKKMEERLVKAERLASIGELAGQLGHDLRNPLAGMKNSIYILRKKGGQLSDFQRSEILDLLDRAVEDSNRIVTSLIEYSNEMMLTPELTTPKRLVSNAFSKLSVPAGVSVQNDAVDETPMLLDTTHMENVFVAVLHNAVQAIPSEGVITVEAARSNTRMVFSFTDTGIGIPEEIQVRLFAPLVTTKAKGMGMSLAICKRVVESHGGTIEIESKVGHGTTVKVSLPVVASRREFADLQSRLTSI